MAPRSSARLRAKRGDNDSNFQAEEPLVELPQSFVEGSSDHSGPRRKKQNTEAPGRKTKKPAPRVKGKRGALQLIVEMPLELFYEVLKLLDPGDLLSLSRANRFLRSLVLDRQAAPPLWKDAFERVEPIPPACPDDLSLPQYANLLYGRTCFFCSSAVGIKISWTCYVRYCKSCFDKVFIDFDFERRSVDRSLIDTRVLHRHVDRRRKCDTFTLKSDYKKQLAIQKNLRGKASYNTYIEQAIEKESSRRKMRRTFEDWEDSLKQAREDDRLERAASREEGILERLREAGYAKELERLEKYYMNPLYDLKQWKNLQPKLVTKIEEQIEICNQIERMKIVRARTKHLRRVYEYYVSHNRDIELFGPQYSDLAKQEPFQALVYAPSEEEITEQHFLAVLDELPKVFQSWKQRTEKTLLRIVEKSLNQSGLRPEVLGKATTIFKCRQCSDLLHHPDVLSHRCNPEKTRDRKQGRKQDRPPIERTEDPNRAWDPNQFAFAVDAFKCARDVIKAIGEDPNNVTPEELDKIDARVENQCYRRTTKHWMFSPRKFEVKSRWAAMDWRRAILEKYELNWIGGCSWKLVSNSAREDVRKEEQNAWRCRRQKQCVECTLFKIVDNKVVAPWKQKELKWPLSLIQDDLGDGVALRGVGVMDEDATTCPAGHDMSMGTYAHRLERGYYCNLFVKNSPKPVEMVTVELRDFNDPAIADLAIH